MNPEVGRSSLGDGNRRTDLIKCQENSWGAVGSGRGVGVKQKNPSPNLFYRTFLRQ